MQLPADVTIYHLITIFLKHVSSRHYGDTIVLFEDYENSNSNTYSNI